MTPLAAKLADLIRAQGPIPVSVYMAACLGDSDHGYYTGRDPLGQAGDFTTAPEISQMFGELIGLWCAAVWQSMGSPHAVALVELGPGRGTLMADALRAAKALPPFLAAADLHLVESSPTLRAAQKTALSGHDVSWHDRIDTLPGGPLIVVANEFFDALPIRQYVRRPDGWHERHVDVSEEGDGFRFVLAPDTVDLDADAPDGAVVEACPSGRAIAQEIGRRIHVHGGAALIIDYGPARPGPGDSLQAVRNHRYHPVLDDPGEADLTAHVDFAALAAEAQATGAKASAVLNQGAFLRAMGIDARAEALTRKATETQKQGIFAAHERLTAPHAMGHLFKVMTICHPDLPRPPGFEDDNLWP
jgi:SAM-dependent MidA family methyltransferase